MALEPKAVCEFQLALRCLAELVHIIVDFVNYFITKTVILTLVVFNGGRRIHLPNTVRC